MSQMDIDTPVFKGKGKGKGKEKALAVTDELDNLPWVEKYRPQTLDDLVSHEDITSTSKTAIASCCPSLAANMHTSRDVH